MPIIQGDRAQELINAPGSIAPQKVLTTSKEIRKAVQRNVGGGNYGVYCIFNKEKHRVTEARTSNKILQVKTFTGWVTPTSVFVEG